MRLSSQDEDGDTPLHNAISKGQWRNAEILIDTSNADFTLMNKSGFNPLHLAVTEGKERYVDKHFYLP